MNRSRFLWLGSATLLLCSLAPGVRSMLVTTNDIGTKSRDFIQPGTQPDPVPPGLSDPILAASSCSACHGYFDPNTEPYFAWVASQKAQAARNPMFWATLAIANQDAGNAGYWCMRCHIPIGFLGGRTTFVSDGSILDDSKHDFDGVNCNMCHRLVDPVYDPNENPHVDLDVMPGGESAVDVEPHNGMFIVDLFDRRRGPRDDLDDSFAWHQWLPSPFHEESLLCANCHDVSSTIYMRQSDGTYTLTTNNEEHPTHDKLDEFPLERTFGEWAFSDYAVAPLDTAGRFGGNDSNVSSCQDCHMPKTSGYAAFPDLGAHFRTDLATHGFNGANTWVRRAVRALFSDGETGLSDEAVAAAEARTLAMHQTAADLWAFERGDELVVRVVNHTGHKLPSGFVEGRRMWIHARFLDASGSVLEERGAYDGSTATLDATTTTVYEARHGVDDTVSALTGIPAGHSFHMAVNNEVLFDNRIPPRGFSNAEFEAIHSEPLGHSYPEQHYWDDTTFAIPHGTSKVEVELYYQTTAKEFIEFVRDANTTNSAGQTAYDQWVAQGMSAPARMASSTLDLAVGACPDPIPYGRGKTTSIGTEPTIRKLGNPTYSANNFRLQVQNGKPNQFGVLFWSDAPATAPFFGGTRYIANPLKRQATFLLNSNGGAVIPIPVLASMVDTERYYQAYFRDPADPLKVAVTSAIHVDFCQ
jgi:hypothetical protein